MSKRESLKDSTNTNRDCFLCGKACVNYMTRFCNWSEEAKSFVIKHLNQTPSPNATICKKDHLEARRYSNDSTYVSKWKVQQSPQECVTKCTYPYCDKTSSCDTIIKASFAPPETIRQVIGNSSSDDLLLCKSHYNLTYRSVFPPMKCASCQAHPKIGSTFRHYSPDAQTVTTYLQESGTTYTEVEPNQLICLTCYKMHASILASIEAQDVPVDDSLLSDLDLWQQVQSDTSSVLTRAILMKLIFNLCDIVGYLHQKTVGGSVTMMDHTQLTGKILHTKKELERILTTY